MPLNHGQGNIGGEATGDDTGSSPRDSDLLQRKRKTVFEDTETNQGSVQGEQSYATFTPDDSDGEATDLDGEIQGYHHVLKKRKATPAGLLMGTPMEDLYVVPAKIDSASTSPAVIGVHHLYGSKLEPPSPSTQTRPVGHLVNDCIENAVQTTHKERGHIEVRAQPGFLGNSSDETLDTLDGNDNITEGSFVIVTSSNGGRSQLFSASTDFAPPCPIPATRPHIIRPSPKHKGEKATDMNKVEVGENTHERSTRGAPHDLITKSQNPDSADTYGPGKRIMHVGGTHGSAIPEGSAQALSSIQSKADDKEYEFVEHPEPHSIQRFRQIPAIVRDPSDGVEHPVIVNADNWSDSNFISSNIVKKCGFHQRPLVGKDVVTYRGLAGACTPKMYVRLELKLREVSEHYKESFRVVDNDDFELIVGAATIQERRIPLQEQTARSAFTAFKKQPTKDQAAAQQASQKQDHKLALELSNNIPPFNTTPRATQSSRNAKDDPHNTPNSSIRTSTNSTTASGSISTSSSSTSSKNR